MNPVSILYIGTDSGTSRHRIQALRRLGHRVYVIDPRSSVMTGRLFDLWMWKTGSLFLENIICQRVLESVPRGEFDLAYVNSGELVGPSLVRELKRRIGRVITYNMDDPYGERDGNRWRLYLRAVPLYDLVVVLRAANVGEATAMGAKDVLRVSMSADEVAHSPRNVSASDRDRWSTEVLFIGTWMPERGPLLARLIQFGVPLSIYGDRWQKAPEWPFLRPYWRGAGIYDDELYAKAVQCAKVTLGLLSKGNRDLSTTRSFEIPHLGGVLCAERTHEHKVLYQEDEEAVFWSSPEECAQKCLELLDNQSRRQRIAMNGRARCLANRTTNEHVLSAILCRALGVEQDVRTTSVSA